MVILSTLAAGTPGRSKSFTRSSTKPRLPEARAILNGPTPGGGFLERLRNAVSPGTRPA